MTMHSAPICPRLLSLLPGTSTTASGKFCYAFVAGEGVSGIAITDKEYPSRVAVSMLKDLVAEMLGGDNRCVHVQTPRGACGFQNARWTPSSCKLFRCHCRLAVDAP